jgi:hypothetical protein
MGHAGENITFKNKNRIISTKKEELQSNYFILHRRSGNNQENPPEADKPSRGGQALQGRINTQTS